MGKQLNRQLIDLVCGARISLPEKLSRVGDVNNTASKSIYELSAEGNLLCLGANSKLEKRFFCGTLDGNSVDNTRMGEGTRSDK